MTKRKNLINTIISFVLTIGAIILIILGGKTSALMIKNVAYFLAGALVFGLLNAFIHELGHLIFGKKNGFILSSMTVWFFNWTRVSPKKIKFSFCLIGNEAGYTEMIPKTDDNMEKKMANMSLGGIVFSFCMMVLSLLPFIFQNKMKLEPYLFLSISFPISVYYFFGNLLPMINEGVRNDGAVYFGIKRKENSMLVALNISRIHANLYQGKSPSEIDSALYFDLPQLPEDDLNFIMLLDLRYEYYLDSGDTENAIKTLNRLQTLEDYMPKYIRYKVKTDALYHACFVKKNENEADDLMEELEKYLNKNNDPQALRAKMAYLIYIVKDLDNIEMFYNKALREIDKLYVLGLKKYEEKLLTSLTKDVFEVVEEN